MIHHAITSSSQAMCRTDAMEMSDADQHFNDSASLVEG